MKEELIFIKNFRVTVEGQNSELFKAKFAKSMLEETLQVFSLKFEEILRFIQRISVLYPNNYLTTNVLFYRHFLFHGFFGSRCKKSDEVDSLMREVN